jgi:hypothetical protein
MDIVSDCRNKGLIRLMDFVWVTTEPCAINRCELDRGTLILHASVGEGNFTDYHRKFKQDDLLIVNDPDLISITGKTQYSNNLVCKLLPADNTCVMADQLQRVNFAIRDLEFVEQKSLSKIVLDSDTQMGHDRGGIAVYDFACCIETMKLFVGKENMQHILSNDDYDNNLANICAFGVNIRNVKGTLDVEWYTPLKYGKGIYLKTFKGGKQSELVWLTNDDVMHLNNESMYGILSSHEVPSSFDVDNEELNLLRFVEGIHDYRYEFDTGAKIYNDNLELNHMFADKADFDNLYNAIKLNENGIKTGITKNNYFEFVHRKGLVNSITKQDLYFSMLPDVGFDIPDYDKRIE